MATEHGGRVSHLKSDPHGVRRPIGSPCGVSPSGRQAGNISRRGTQKPPTDRDSCGGERRQGILLDNHGEPPYRPLCRRFGRFRPVPNGREDPSLAAFFILDREVLSALAALRRGDT
jgi:hypothetical protein